MLTYINIRSVCFGERLRFRSVLTNVSEECDGKMTLECHILVTFAFDAVSGRHSKKVNMNQRIFASLALATTVSATFL